jgi:tRNA G18 (ribose-2'-O)-methylase SpoU
MQAPHIVVIAHNIRSAHNIGSIFRTCDGFAVEHLYLTGYSPYPLLERDTRLPHIAQKVTGEIIKTSLGAEKTVLFAHMPSPYSVIDGFKAHGYSIIGLEQNKNAVSLSDFSIPSKLVLILGEEVDGISSDILSKCDSLVEIPMHGQKESFNVSVAAGIALYGLRYGNKEV